MTAVEAGVEPGIASDVAHREWAELSARAPQMTATMRRYLVQLTTFLAPSSVHAADMTLRQLAGAEPGAGEQLHEQPGAWVGVAAGGGHPSGGVAVVEELRQGFWAGWDVAVEDRLRRGASGQSQSMSRSKKMRIIRSRWRWVFFARVAAWVPGRAASHTLKSSKWLRVMSSTEATSVCSVIQRAS